MPQILGSRWGRCYGRLGMLHVCANGVRGGLKDRRTMKKGGRVLGGGLEEGNKR